MIRALGSALVFVAVLSASAAAATPKTVNPLGIKIAAGATNAGPFAAKYSLKSGGTMNLHVTSTAAIPVGDVLEVEWQGTGSMGGWHAFATCSASPCDELARQTEVGTVQFRAVVKKSPYSLKAKALSSSSAATVSWTR